MSKKASIIPLSLRRKPSYNAASERENNIIGKRIQELRKRNSMSLDNLSRLLAGYGVDVQGGTINKWETGVSVPNSYQLVAVCKALDVGSPDYFTAAGIQKKTHPELNELGMKKLAEYKEDLIASGRYTPIEERTASNIVYLEMPISNLRASAGTGAFLDEGNYELVRFPQNLIPKGAEFGVRVSGDSMQPVYNDGTIVWVQKCDALCPGEVGIFIYDGEGYIKAYEEQVPADPEAFTDSSGVCHMQPVLVSFNTKYAPKEISPDIRFEIVGRVLN